MVELAMGCSHITCTCSHHFCYACGGAWNLATSRCNAVPPCDLWDPVGYILILARIQSADEIEAPQQILLLAPQNRIQEPAPPAPPAPPALPAAPVHPALVDLELADLQRQIQELRAEHEVRERMRAQEAEADRRRVQREDNQRRQRIVDAVEDETRRRQAQSEADRERRRITLELQEETRRRQLQSHTAKERNRLRREAEERMREAQAEQEMLQAREARRATERDSNMRKLHWLGGSKSCSLLHHRDSN
jgi:DNA repair exonuclease SbcCD ATPase subunit